MSVLPRPFSSETGLPDRALVRSRDRRRPFHREKRYSSRRSAAARSCLPPIARLSWLQTASGKVLFLWYLPTCLILAYTSRTCGSLSDNRVVSVRYSYLTGYESGGAHPGRFDIPPGKRGQIYDAASRVVQQVLSQIEGVGHVQIGGSSLPAVQVELNPLALFKSDRAAYRDAIAEAILADSRAAERLGAQLNSFILCAILGKKPALGDANERRRYL
jgi:hypothetical protein